MKEFILNWTRRFFTVPGFQSDHIETRRIVLLHAMSLALLGMAGVWSVIDLLLFRTLRPLVVFGVLIVLRTVVLSLLRKGKAKMLSVVLVILLWLGFTSLSLTSGGVHSPHFISYIIVILIAGLLLGGRAALWVTALSALSGLGMFHLAYLDLLPQPVVVLTSFGSWGILSVNFALGALLIFLTLHSMNQALAHARESEQALAQQIVQNQQLAQETLEASEFKSRLISRMSHELRTPLAAIYGLTEMLHYAVYGQLTPPQREATEKILRHAHRLEDLVADMLAQVECDLARLGVQMVEFSPLSLVQGALTTFEPLARNKGLEMRVEVADAFPDTVRGDADKIVQVLNSLLSNAVKFTEQGDIVVRLHQPDADCWALSVSDTGIGIPEQARDYIFEPFRQLDESPTRQHGGIGLGLALVQQLATLMGATVTVESEVGVGSTFTVTFPMALADDD